MSLGNISRRLFRVSLLFSIFAVQALLAQYGTLKGRVFDKDTKEDLPGANIVFKGTSMGMSTDLNGEFTIYNVPSGQQTVTVSYLGYVTINVPIEIIEDEVVKQDFLLTPQALEGEVVLVTAQAQGQLQAINQQINSNKIVSVVSEAKIQELPDFNAAAAIGRLPGVSTLQSSGEANKIVIRGLAPQYNQVSVGGISLASTGSTQIGASSLQNTSGAVNNDRSVDLTMVTPYMIKSIEVYKSLTPDMEANAIGGVVNMELREAPSGLHGDVLYQSGYTDKSNNYGNYRGVVSLSNRFFDDQLGIYVLGNSEEYDRDADNMTANYQGASSVVGASGFKAVRVTSVTLMRHIETRKRYGGNLILDYKLPNGSIKSVNMFSRLNSITRDYNTILNYNNVNHSLDFQYRDADIKTDLAVNSLQVTNDFGFISVDIKAANSYSRNYLPRSPFFTFFQNGALSNSVTGDTNKVPEDLTRYVNYGPDTTTYLGSTNLFKSDYKENGQVYKTDFKMPLNLGLDISGFLKFGGMYRYNQHKTDQSTPYISMRRQTTGNPNQDTKAVDYLLTFYPDLKYSATGQLMASNFGSTDSKLLASFLDDKFGAKYWSANADILNRIVDLVSSNPDLRGIDQNQGGWFDGPYQQLPNDYKYIEKYYAAYLMAELNFGSQLQIVGGARYEQTKGLYFAYNLRDERNPTSQRYFPVTAYPQNHFWLPQIQSKFQIYNWVDLRYSYTQTLARPSYNQLTPHYTISVDGGGVNSGNPNLKPARSYNHDVLVSFHSNNLGLLSIGGFYKEIEDFAFRSSYGIYHDSVYNKFGIKGLTSINSFAPFVVNTGATLNTFSNTPYMAYVRGIETDFQTRFWYLPSPLDGIVFGVNYTHIWSKAVYPLYGVTASRGRVTWYSDSSRIGRLIFQPNDIINSYIGYDFSGFSARVSVIFQGNSVSNIGEYPEEDGFTKDYFRIDASVRQRLPWDGLQVFLEMSNINNEINMAAQESIGGFTSQNYYGLTANLGLRYGL